MTTQGLREHTALAKYPKLDNVIQRIQYPLLVTLMHVLSQSETFTYHLK